MPGKLLSARGVEYGIEIRAGETLLYRYEDNAFPKNTQMKGRLWADAELPDNIGGQTLSLTFTQLSDRTDRFDAPLLGSVRSITGHHIQTSLFSLVMMLAMVILAVLALLIFCYMSSCGIRECRFLDVAVFLLLCSLWCLTDSALYQILRTGYCRRKRRFLLRLYADVYPDGAFCPQHDKRQTAARSRYMHCTVLRQRARTGRGVPAFRHPVY